MKTTRKSLIFAMTLLFLTGCGSDNSGKTETNFDADHASKSPSAASAADAAGCEERNAAEGEREAADMGGDAETMDYSAEKRMDAELPAAAAVADGGGETGTGADDPDPGLPFENSVAEPFVLTAGEWNDNENWGFFANLVHNGTIAFPSYGLDPTGRVAVTVTHDGAAVQNQTVLLNAGNTHIWQAKTDRNGKAYLFYGADYAGQTLTVETEGAEQKEIAVPGRRDEGQGGSSVPTLEVTVETGVNTNVYDMTQVMFILDTTGSMGDEITYLQKDFSEIAKEVAGENTAFSVNFYRDDGDDYVTRCNPFTTDISALQKALNAEYADGGGDAPEAVAEILDQTMNSSDWQENTNKIAFLIFDAPPHSGSENERQIRGAVEAAAAKGIHLVPVVASNADRDTEVFGRALSVMTNSNYVFLTDDSGVGDSHLEPIIGDYEVELLHDIIVRNIREIAGS